MSIIESVKEYMSECPLLKDGKINVDFLDSHDANYTIEPIPCEPVVKHYIGGSTLRQYEFILASREFFGTDVVQNIQNSAFYEDFAKWIEDNNRDKKFPVMSDDQSAEKIEVLTHGCLMTEDAKTAVYQIQLKMSYIQEV